MAVKSQFPLFAPPSLRPDPLRPVTEIRFSRWNNAGAQKIIRHERTQKELEDQIRIERRFDSALTIAHNFNPAPPHPTTFRSTGTPSSPSSPSIPGKKSKYSKQQQSSHKSMHPAFEPLSGLRKLPAKADNPQTPAEAPNFRIDDNGVSYEMPDAPFLYQYSYTETPKVKPVKLREPLVSPFGPVTMAKPWLGRKPLPLSKKKLPEFDSFKLPPSHKKGVKPVQAPGPFLAGSGPKYVRSREEILGAPLTKEEIEDLVNGSKKSNRQLNMGRDGLTHNMLDNIHALWKRRRVCKIKCKGVCTVDMKNVCQQLEEKTGGKIIYNRGGVVYLFRGRNYNFKSRPRYPLMLWKPISPVYPRLIKRVPDGLTLEEASEMRRKGRDLIPICNLAKNGVYCDLVKNVREAFEACELVRINCQGLNPSDYKKIGAKLKDLVPCVLLSFEFEHILMWRGRDWKFTLMGPNESSKGLQKADNNAELLVASPSSNPQTLSSTDGLETSLSPTRRNEEFHSSEEIEGSGEPSDADAVADAPLEVNNVSSVTSQAVPSNVDGGPCVAPDFNGNISAVDQTVDGEILSDGLEESQTRPEHTESGSTVSNSSSPQLLEQLTDSENNIPQPHWPSSNSNGENVHQVLTSSIPAANGILLLRNQAVESGMALVLDNCSLDAATIFRQAVAFSKTAPPGPVFHYGTKKSAQKSEEQESNSTEPEEAPTGLPAETEAPSWRSKTITSRTDRLVDIKADYLNAVPKGGLRVDELAKLLA